jgi:hypothetical protein
MNIFKTCLGKNLLMADLCEAETFLNLRNDYIYIFLSQLATSGKGQKVVLLICKHSIRGRAIRTWKSVHGGGGGAA